MKTLISLLLLVITFNGCATTPEQQQALKTVLFGPIIAPSPPGSQQYTPLQPRQDPQPYYPSPPIDKRGVWNAVYAPDGSAIYTPPRRQEYDIYDRNGNRVGTARER